MARSLSAHLRSIPRRGRVFALLGAVALLVSACGQGNVSIKRVATGLENPRGVGVMPDGRLVIVEAGNGIDTGDVTLETGRVSVLEDLNADGDYDDEGEITPMLTQLPSYNTLTTFGTGHDEVGGTGDVVVLDDGSMYFTRDDPSEGYAADGSSSGVNVVPRTPADSHDFQAV